MVVIYFIKSRLQRHPNFSEPGVFEFEKPSLLVRESVGVSRIPVMRHSGTDGTCSVFWKAIVVSENLGNCSEEWGSPSEGRVNFQHGEANGCIELSIVDQGCRMNKHAFCMEKASTSFGML